jgi:SpoVK/Ycf46/Vps4 family AAA+-type ATPase
MATQDQIAADHAYAQKLNQTGTSNDPTPYMVNPQQIANSAINGLAMKYCGDLFDADFNTLSLKTIVKFLAMLSLQELKSVITEILSSIKYFLKNPSIMIGHYKVLKDNVYILAASVWVGLDQCKGVFGDILESITEKVRSWFVIKKQIVEQDIYEPYIVTPPKQSVPIGFYTTYHVNCKNSSQFWYNFIKYINMNTDTCKFKTSNKLELDEVNMKSLLSREKISDISIQLDNDVMFVINDTIHYKKNQNGDITDLVISDTEKFQKSTDGESSISNIADLITNPKLKEHINKICSQEVLGVDLTKVAVGYCCYCKKPSAQGDGLCSIDNHICVKFANILCNAYPSLNLILTYTQIEVLYLLVSNALHDTGKNCHTESNDIHMVSILEAICKVLNIEAKYNGASVEDSLNHFTVTSNVVGKNSQHYLFQYKSNSKFSKYSEYRKGFNRDVLNDIMTNFSSTPTTVPLEEPIEATDVCTKTTSKKHIKIKMISPIAIHTTHYQKLLYDFVDTVRHHNKSEIHTKVQVFELCLKRFETVKQIPNPAYKAYIEEKQAEEDAIKEVQDNEQGNTQPNQSDNEDADNKDNKDDTNKESNNIQQTVKKDKSKKDKKKKTRNDSSSDTSSSDSEYYSGGSNRSRKSKHKSKKKNRHRHYDSRDLLRGFGGQQQFPFSPYNQSQFMNMTPKKKPVPVKEIDVTEQHYKIVSEYVSDIEKDISTLYLPQNDLRKLLYVMDNFKNGKEMLKELGLPYKMGLLLHGEAGTGKSTTIRVAACFLGKNIYYINLRDVRTNRELKDLFDYVNKECAGGGIMVFEDIDVMTSVVHPRKINDNTTDMGMHDLLNSAEGDLTLSYLLNLLDGTLCTDDTLFIMTTSQIKNLDPDLIRKGRIDIEIKLERCDHFQIQSIYQRILKKELPPKVMRQIKEYAHKPVDVIYEVLQYVYNPDEDDIVIMNQFIDKELAEQYQKENIKSKSLKNKPFHGQPVSYRQNDIDIKDDSVFVDALVTNTPNALVASTVN